MARGWLQRRERCGVLSCIAKSSPRALLLGSLTPLITHIRSVRASFRARVASERSERSEYYDEGDYERHRAAEKPKPAPVPAHVPKEAKKEDEEKAEADMCKICFEKPSDCVILECGHVRSAEPTDQFYLFFDLCRCALVWTVRSRWQPVLCAASRSLA